MRSSHVVFKGSACQVRCRTVRTFERLTVWRRGVRRYDRRRYGGFEFLSAVDGV